MLHFSLISLSTASTSSYYKSTFYFTCEREFKKKKIIIQLLGEGEFEFEMSQKKKEKKKKICLGYHKECW